MNYIRLKWVGFLLLNSFIIISGCRTWTIAEQIAVEAYNSGNKFRDAKRFQKATESYRKALSIKPQMKAASFNLALTLTEMGEFDESMTILGQLQKREPKNLVLMRSQGWVLRRAQNYEEALFHYEKALEVFEDDVISLKSIIDIYENTQQVDNAIQYLKKLLDIEKSTENHLKLAFFLKSKNAYQESLEEYRKAIHDKNSKASDLLAAGQVAEELDFPREALEYYKRAAQSDSGQTGASAAFYLARLHLLVFFEFAEGLDSFKQALEKGFDDDKLFFELLAEVEPELIPNMKELFAQY